MIAATYGGSHRKELMVTTENTTVAEVVQAAPGAPRVFDKHGLQGCGGAHGPTEPL